MKFIKGFDGLRCYSVLIVIITHLGVANYLPPRGYLRENAFYFFSGGAGVNIFFAISGFLITMLILHEIKTTGAFNVTYFFARRFIRLLPPILPFYLLLLLFMMLGYVRWVPLGVIASALYMFNFVPRAKFIFSTELSHTWSLAVEEQFYLIWAFVFYRLRRVESILLVAGVLLAACVVLVPVLSALTVEYENQTYALTTLFYPLRWALPAIGPILIGAITALMNFRYAWEMEVYGQRKWAGPLALFVFLSPFYLPGLLLPWIHFFHALGVRTGPNSLPQIWVHDFPVNVLLTFVFAIVSYEFYEKRILGYKKKFKVA